jgi:nucleotide-binding universal stress UspA family protein
MARETEPVLVAYDGSEVSKAALRQAAELLPERPAVLATVWEPGLAVLPAPASDPLGAGSLPPDPETMEAVDRAQHEHAERVAQQGAELARSLGLRVEAHAVPDEVDVADTLIQLADERSAAAIVVGSHGISGLRARLLGSVARKLIEHSARPVLVVREHEHQ